MNNTPTKQKGNMKATIWTTAWLDQFRMKKIRFYREIELPFAPFIGLEFSLDDGNFEAKLEEVCWNGESFDCWAGGWDEKNDESGEKITETMLENGWKVEN